MKKIIIFVICLCLFTSNIFLFADDSKMELETLNKDTMKSEGGTATTESAKKQQEAYKTLVNSYGFNVKIDCTLLSTPQYRKGIKNPNSKYYCNLIVSELVFNKTIGFSAISSLSSVLEVLDMKHEITESGDIRTLSVNFDTNNIDDINYILGKTNYIYNIPYDGIQGIGDQKGIFLIYLNNNNQNNEFVKFLLSNVKFNLIYKTRNEIVNVNPDKNNNHLYLTNEDSYNVYKYEFNPSLTTDNALLLIEKEELELTRTNRQFQLIILSIFNILFFIYYIIEIKKRGD